MAPQNIAIAFFSRKSGMDYVAEIKDVYERVDNWGAHASIELHFNAAGPTATGTETLVSTSKSSQDLGRLMNKAMVRHLGLRDRGLKVVQRHDRGGWSLYAGSAPACLVEPFFATNEEDLAATERLGVAGMARMYLEGIMAWVKTGAIIQP
jgi:N-acetylmuramoyl-L-alanine amidase